MKHNIRINGEVKEIDCELGSGIKDKNGVEIFEGDKVKTPDNEIVRVRFENGVIGLVVYESKENHSYSTKRGQHRRNPFLAPLYIFRDFEVVGHANVPHFKDTGRAWSPQLHDAYNRLLDACIARKSPEAVCEAALTVVQAAKADNRFEED